MASVMDAQDSALENWPKWDRKEQIKMRYSGQEYVSKSGKVIPAKKQPELICTCPQKCGDKIPQDARERLFKEFYRLSDHALQNRFLQAHIEIRAVQRRFWRQQQRTSSGRSQRRVSCKYQVPLIQSAADVTFDGRTKPGIPIVEVCQKAFMNVYAITEKRVRIQRERLICQAQEFAAANGGSPLQPVDSLSLIGHRPIQPKPQAKGGENFYHQNQDVSPKMTTLGNSNVSISPAPLLHPRQLISKLGERDITMVPAHINSSLSILPIKGDTFPFKSGFPNGKTNPHRDITMIPLSESGDDQAMPTDLSVRKKSIPKDLSLLNIPSATTIVPVPTAISNQPVDLSVKSSKPKMYEEPDLKYKRKSGNKYKAVKQEYESEAEMDGDEGVDYDMDVEAGTEAGMDGDMAIEQAYEPEVDSELESRPSATPDSMHSDKKGSEPHFQPFIFQPNGYDIALVNSFFQNQLWQPEFIDTELLREFYRKKEELKEKKRKQRQVLRAKASSESGAPEDQDEKKGNTGDAENLEEEVKPEQPDTGVIKQDVMENMKQDVTESQEIDNECSLKEELQAEQVESIKGEIEDEVDNEDDGYDDGDDVRGATPK